MRWELSCGGIGLEDWAANVTLRATSPRQVRLAGGRRDSGRVRLRAEGVAGKAYYKKSCEGRCCRQSTAWLAGCFRTLDCLRGSGSCGEVSGRARAEQGLPRRATSVRWFRAL